MGRAVSGVGQVERRSVASGPGESKARSGGGGSGESKVGSGGDRWRRGLGESEARSGSGRLRRGPNGCGPRESEVELDGIRRWWAGGARGQVGRRLAASGARGF
jgi:hypothetical protein